MTDRVDSSRLPPRWAAALPVLVCAQLLIPWTAVPAPRAQRGEPGEPGEPAVVEQPVSFQRSVRPLLARACFRCHGPDEGARKGKLRLDLREHAVTGRRGDPGVIVPGDAHGSELMARITTDDFLDRMPPEETGRVLTRTEVELLRQWIDEGAPYDTHWAWMAPVREPVPDGVLGPGSDGAPGGVPGEWPRGDLDRWVLARLAAEGLQPSPPADRATLLRRVSLDLTGLPPSPAEVDAFAADEQPGAYERCVERLLASPHFGERWARWWLDLARYADTKGYEADRGRTIWPYRDWVIRAFNDDLPFDRFTIEQIAGDLLLEPTQDQLIATAFHRNSMTNDEGGTDDEEFRSAAVVDRVNTTMTTWMGLTAGCAQCHSHKFDPLSQREYYALYAFFNDTADTDAPDDGPLLAVPSESQARELTALDARLALPETELESLAAERAELWAAVPQVPVLRELGADQRRTTRVHVRGNFLDQGEEVAAGVPAVLHPLQPTEASTDAVPVDRRALAAWLVDPANPLTARVTVNRVWEQLFGHGLVETVEDFGVQGELPSHPELLDWLALSFRDGGWSFKGLCRRIVTSATYRQSSRAEPGDWEADPANRLLSRGPRFRLEAEMVRDQALAVAGLLDRTLYGPPVFPPQPEGIWQVVYNDAAWVTSEGGDAHRRALYTYWRRTSPYPSLLIFDAPTRELCSARRLTTNTPLQALVTLNDPVFVEAAQALALRVLREAGADDDARARHAFRLALARPPTADELVELLAVVQRERAHFATRPSAALALTTPSGGDGSSRPAEANDPAELAAWTMLAHVILNLDELLTRP